MGGETAVGPVLNSNQIMVKGTVWAAGNAHGALRETKFLIGNARFATPRIPNQPIHKNHETSVLDAKTVICPATNTIGYVPILPCMAVAHGKTHGRDTIGVRSGYALIQSVPSRLCIPRTTTFAGLLRL